MSNEIITISIRMSTGTRFTIGGSEEATITPSKTILEIKQIIFAMEESGKCAVERQRLIHKGRILTDDQKTLREYGILDSEQTIHLVKSQAAAAVNTGSSTRQPQNTGAAVGTGTAPPNPFAAAFQNPLMGRNANQNMNNMGVGMDMNNMSEMQNQLLNNPDQLSSLMNSPMMQSIMSNPDFLRSMMESNPQMRQLLDSNPELRHMLDDPDLMRRSMEMMRDPNAMQNMMRNQDLAMSQIENIPGGFSALRRMYEDVQAPMMDAMATGGRDNADGSSGENGGNTTGSTNERSGAAGTAMPNPWASNTNTNTSGGGATASPSSSSGPPNPFSGMPNPWAAAGAGAGTSNDAMGMSPNMNLEQTIQMLENPMMNQMMNSLMSDPAAMESILNSNPMLRQLRQTNPQVAAMLSNPETMRAMMDPNNLRSMMQMQNAMQQLGQNMPPGSFPGIMPGMGMGFPGMNMGNTNSSTGTGTGTPSGAPPAAPGLDFSSLLSQMQSTSIGAGSNMPAMGSVAGARQAPNVIPHEQRYRIQLQSLNDMGFDDNPVNIAALVATHGNVNRAIDMLLTDPPTPLPTSADTSASTTNGGTNETTTQAEQETSDDVEDKNAVDKKND